MFFWRWTAKNDASLPGALRGASLFALVVLVITRGRPSRMFDPKPSADDAPAASTEEGHAPGRTLLSVRIHQAAFIVCVLLFFTIYALTGASFLD